MMLQTMTRRYFQHYKHKFKIRGIHLESTLITFLSAILILRIAIPNGFGSLIKGINLETFSTASAIRKAWGLGDSGSLLEAALTWANFQQLDPTTQYWIVRVWSPGLAVIEVPLIWFEKLGIPIFWSLLFFTTCLWLVIVYLLWWKIAPITGRKSLFLILAILLLGWDFEYFFGNGLFYSEGISLAALILGLFIIVWSLVRFNEFKTNMAVIGGFLVGISIWVRHVNDNGLILILISSSIFYVLARKPNKFLKIKQTRHATTRPDLP